MATNDELEEQIKQIKRDIQDLNDSLGEMEKKSKGLNKSLGDTSNIIGSAAERMKDIAKSSSDFAKSLKLQYQLGEKLAGYYKETSVEIGISVQKQHEFGRAFISATSKAEALGGEVRDVSRAYSAFIEESGRARIIDPEEIENIIALEKSTGLMGESAARMMERFDLMGKSAESSMEAIESIYRNSLKLGLNASKVTKVLSDNFKSMQMYSFREGVKGMTKMSQLAVKMRTDVGTMLGMADKFYNPEQAIEAVANLQMLGGDIAQAFGDPFEIMYLARNKPEELAAKVGKMTENMISFNSATGEMDMPAEVRMQLQAAGEQLLGNKDALIDIARQTSKIKNIKMHVDSNITDPDMREGIASLARMDKNNNWVVDFEGKPIDIGNASELQEAVNSGLLDVPTTEEDAILVTAKEAMTTNKYLDQINISLKTGLLSKNNIYMGAENVLSEPIKEFHIGMTENMNKLTDAIGDTGIKDALVKMQELAGGVSGDWIGEMNDVIAKTLDKTIETIKKGFEISEITTERMDVTSNGPVDVTTKIVGDMSNNNNSSNVNHSGDVNVNTTVTIKADKVLEDLGIDITSITPELKKEIIKHIQQIMFNGGVPTSKDAQDWIGE